MKHITTIQKDFIKKATKWNDLSREQQQDYLKKHRKSKRRLTNSQQNFDSWLSSQEKSRPTPYEDPFSKEKLKETHFINLQTGKPSLFSDLPTDQQNAIKAKYQSQQPEPVITQEQQKPKRKKFTVTSPSGSSTIRAIDAMDALKKSLSKNNTTLSPEAQTELDKQPIDSDTISFGKFTVTPFNKEQRTPKLRNYSIMGSTPGDGGIIKGTSFEDALANFIAQDSDTPKETILSELSTNSTQISKRKKQIGDYEVTRLKRRKQNEPAPESEYVEPELSDEESAQLKLAIKDAEQFNATAMEELGEDATTKDFVADSLFDKGYSEKIIDITLNNLNLY